VSNAPPVIVLDLDDTLYLERDYVRSGIAAVGKWMQDTLQVGGFAEAATASFADGRRERLFDAAFEMIGVEASPALIARTVYEYRRHRPAIQLTSDSKHFLDRFAESPLALVTDGWALSQRMKVSSLGLRGRLSPIIYTDDWGRPYWKPHLRAYRQVEAMLGRGRSFIYIADNPAKDFVGPRALGWRTVQIVRAERLHREPAPTAGHRADLRIESFEELTEAAMRDLMPQHELIAVR
jgi:putative hydrolase of the HAD superfamily